jgi:hypothetical protein
LEDGGKMIIDIFNSCERADAPCQKGKVRATTFGGVIFETCDGGSKYTFMARVDPRGSIPDFVVNVVAEGTMKVSKIEHRTKRGDKLNPPNTTQGKLKMLKEYFVDNKNPDGSDNGGLWPVDESIFGFKVEKGGGEKEKEQEERVERAGPSHPALLRPSLSSTKTGLLEAAKKKKSLGKVLADGIVVARSVLGYVFVFFGAFM